MRVRARNLSLTIIAGSSVLYGCYVAPAAYPPLVSPQPVAQMGGASGPGPIEAGCSFNATQLQGQIGSTFQIACPPGCEQSGGLWGTDVYTGDSSICRAGIHAGAIPMTGGVVAVQLQPGRPAFRGSARYNVQSHDYGQYGSSFQVLLPQGQPGVAAQPQPAAPQMIEAGCSFNATQINGAVGSAHLISCPPGCASQGGLWGTDIYTGDSGICHAAIHFGLLSPNGGPVVVILDVGRPAYRGTLRNGVQSHDYGNYASSFRLQRP
jgi:hypothetical protein